MDLASVQLLHSARRFRRLAELHVGDAIRNGDARDPVCFGFLAHYHDTVLSAGRQSARPGTGAVLAGSDVDLEQL